MKAVFNALTDSRARVFDRQDRRLWRLAIKWWFVAGRYFFNEDSHEKLMGVVLEIQLARGDRIYGTRESKER